jgi:hypothetical protein
LHRLIRKKKENFIHSYLQKPLVDHIRDTSGGSDDELLPLLEQFNVIADEGTTNTGMALNLQVFSEGEADLRMIFRKVGLEFVIYF